MQNVIRSSVRCSISSSRRRQSSCHCNACHDCDADAAGSGNGGNDVARYKGDWLGVKFTVVGFCSVGVGAMIAKCSCRSYFYLFIFFFLSSFVRVFFTF